MKKTNFMLLFIICAALILVLAQATRLWAQQTKANAPQTTAIAQKKAANVEANAEKKMMLGFDVGYFVPLQDLGKIVNGQASGRIFFQYQDIAWWFGLGADLGYTMFHDKKFAGDIGIFYILAHPFLTFDLPKNFDIQLLFGVGIAIASADLTEGSTNYKKTTADPMIDAGLNLIYNFLGRYAVGIEFKYYGIIENVVYSGIEASAFFAVKF